MRTCRERAWLLIVLLAELSIGYLHGAIAQAPSVEIDQLANIFVQQKLAYDPTITYSTGLPTADHSRFPDRTPEALAAFDSEESADLDVLRKIDSGTLPASSRSTYANLKEQLESDLQLRVCKTELWNVNHFFGWQSTFAQIAEQQPVSTAGERAQALKRWASVPRYLDVEISNLRHGLMEGYSAPKSVVLKVIAQTSALASAPVEKSTFYSPVARSNDPAFKAAFVKLISLQIDPAVKRYHDFLQNEYLPKAREGVAVSDLPNGPACYQAFLRKNTTLNRAPQQVYDLGLKTVAENDADISKLGKEMFGGSDLPTILAAIKTRPEYHFKSADDLLLYSRTVLARAKMITAERVIDRMPRQGVIIKPERDFEEAAGVTSHFEANPDTSKPAIFRIQLSNWRTDARGQAAITVAHETWPGHHLQIALARELEPDTALSKLIFNYAYIEGWARYVETLAEEAGIYDSKDSAIWVRVTPARGMVFDTGLHAMHWTRQQAINYLVASGLFTANEADDIVDRSAVLPGQLTSYDSGGLEIKALRREAQATLGNRFDLRGFDRAVLEEGVVPLSELRIHVEAWIQAKSAAQP